MLFIVRPLLKGAMSGGGPMAMLGGPVTRLTTSPDGQPMQIAIDPATGQQMALPGPGGDGIEQKIDIARIEGQVKASSVKRVAEFVDKHPEESVSIIRSWLHESA
jgi:flagellar M-ring protein FliF